VPHLPPARSKVRGRSVCVTQDEIVGGLVGRRRVAFVASCIYRDFAPPRRNVRTSRHNLTVCLQYCHPPPFSYLAHSRGNLSVIIMAADHSHAATGSSHSSLEKETGAVPPSSQQIETIRTISKVPGNPNYHEKNGLRTYGDDEDHDHEPPVCSELIIRTIL
jgi:hypothetical protein